MDATPQTVGFDVLTYSIEAREGRDASKFEIDSVTGAIVLLLALESDDPITLDVQGKLNSGWLGWSTHG